MIKKRILIATGIFPPDIGGPATYSNLLLKELPKRDYKVQILTYGEREGGDIKEIKRVSRKWPKGIRHFIYFLNLLRRGFHVDIIFAQDPVSVGLPVILAAKILRKEFVVKVVGDYAWEQGVQRFGVKELLDNFQNENYGFFVETLRQIQKRVCKGADSVITPSFYLKKIVLGWGVKENKIKVIYNAVDIPKIDLSKEDARKELGFSTDKKIILSIGRDVPWKGFSELSKVFSLLEKEISNLKLVIVGKDTMIPREDVFKHLRAADVFVLNTGYEGLSHQILEAMAIGIPIITTNVGGNPELIKDGQNGLLVEYDNSSQLQEAIKKVLFNKVDIAGFVKKSRNFITSLTEEKMINETIKVLS